MRWVRRPGRRPGRGLREGGEGRVGAGRAGPAGLCCFVVPGREGCLALPPWCVFCGQEELLCLGGVAGALHRGRGRRVFVVSRCISRTPRGCSFGGLPCRAGSLGGERGLIQHGEGPRSLDEVENGKSRNCVLTNWSSPGGIWSYGRSLLTDLFVGVCLERKEAQVFGSKGLFSFSAP